MTVMTEQQLDALYGLRREVGATRKTCRRENMRRYHAAKKAAA